VSRPAAHEPLRRRALLLACGRFDDPALPNLRSPRRDAEALGAVLGGPTGVGYEVTTETDGTVHQAQLAIESFLSSARPGDVHLLYFSCHGIQDPDGDLYFAFRDTRRNLPATTTVSAEWVQRRMRASRSRTTIVLVDCCFSGAFLRGMRSRSGVDANVGALVRTLPQGSGVAVLTASGETEFSLEEADDRAAAVIRPSYFTEAVVTGLATGAADLNGDGQITVDELYEYVFDRVVRGPSPQRPLKMGHARGNVVVAEVRHRIPEPPLPARPPQPDRVAADPASDPQLTPWPPLPVHPIGPRRRPFPRRVLVSVAAAVTAAVGGAAVAFAGLRDIGRTPDDAAPRATGSTTPAQTAGPTSQRATDPSTSRPRTTPPSTNKPTSATPLTTVSEIPVGGGRVFEAQKVVVTQPTAGTIKAFSAVCTHQGCTVAGVSGGTVNCPCHGSRYRISDGSVVNGPAPRSLAAKPMRIDGDAIYLG
jgi:Rieske Fe-S protein